MESKELMIGNWVINKVDNSFCTVTAVIDVMGDVNIGINWKDMISYFTLAIIEPILLTPEILEMAGFERVKGKDSIYRFGQIQLYHGIASTLCYTRYDAESYCYLGRTIKYVHELQQLYFALTGTHLKIELK